MSTLLFVADLEEYFQIVQYEPGQFYRPHQDQNSKADSLVGVRLSTFFLYLQTPEAGGATYFPKLGVKVWKMSAGCVKCSKNYLFIYSLLNVWWVIHFGGWYETSFESRRCKQKRDLLCGGPTYEMIWALTNVQSMRHKVYMRGLSWLQTFGCMSMIFEHLLLLDATWMKWEHRYSQMNCSCCFASWLTLTSSNGWQNSITMHNLMALLDDSGPTVFFCNLEMFRVIKA